MGADGKVEIELQLLTAKALKTAKEFGVNLGSALGGGKASGSAGGSGGGASSINSAGKAIDTVVAKIDKLNAALREQRRAALGAWAAMNPGQSRMAQAAELRAARAQGLRGWNSGQFAFTGSLLPGGPGGITAANASGLGTGIPNLSGQSAKEAAAEKLKNFKLIGQPEKALSSSMAGAFIQTFAALAAFRVSIGLISYAFNALLVPLQLMRRVTETEASRRAGLLYSSSLSSGGLPTGFTAYRQSLSSVMGVSERDVFQFSSQIAWLNGKLEVANKSFATTNKILTEQNWRTKILHTNWSAFMSEVGVKFGTVTHNILLGLNSMIEHATKWLHASNKAVSKEEEIKRWKYEGDHVNRLLTISRAGQLLTGKPHPSDKETAEAIGKSTREAYKKAMESWRSMGGKPLSPEGMKEAMSLWDRVHNGGLPSPTTSAQRYQTSPWERMGLVVGASGADNSARKTAANTDKMVQQLAEIHNALSGSKGMAYKKYAGAAHP